jgi:hypothetical protein
MRILLTLAVLMALSSGAFGKLPRQEEAIQTVLLHREGRGHAGVNVTVCQGLATTAASLSSNVVTLTMISNPLEAGFKKGTAIGVYGFTGADGFLNSTTTNGALTTYTILSVSTTQITYALTANNRTSASNGFVVGEGTGACFPLATTYTDTAGTKRVTHQTYKTDEKGDSEFFAAVGVYLVQYSGAAVATSLYEVTIGPSSGEISGFTSQGSIADNSPKPTSSHPRFGTATAGSNPYVDVRAYGVRAVNPNTTPAALGLTVNCTAGINKVSLLGQEGSAGLTVGDGVVIYGCGPANSLGRPDAPIVTPSLAASSTGTGYTVPAATGSATNSYKIVWRDKDQGLTEASPAGSTGTAASTLGPVSVSLSNMSMTDNTVSASTSSPHNLAAGAMIRNADTSDNPDFGGWYIVQTVPTKTSYTYIQGRDSRNGLYSSAASAKGGIVEWFNCNAVRLKPPTNATQAYIYKYDGSAYILYGVSTPVNPALGGDGTYMQWDDFGSTMMGGIRLPAFVPTTAPTSPTSDSLVTTITSISENTLTLATAPSTNVKGATIRFDNAPNLSAVVRTVYNKIGGMIHFPVPRDWFLNCYVINSALTVSGMVVQEGQVCLNDTLTLGSGTQWHGELLVSSGNGAVSCPAFSIACHVPINIVTANPGIVIPASANVSGVTFAPTGNAYTSVFISGGNIPTATFDNDNFLGTSTDLMGVALYAFCPAAEAAGFSFWRDLFYSGIPQTDGSTATPLAIFKNCGEIIMRDIMVNRRGFFVGGNGASAVFDFGYEQQGGITPLITLGGNTAGATIKNVALDTMSHALVANLGGTANNGVGISGVGSPSNGYALVTGNPFAGIGLDGGHPLALVGQNVNVWDSVSGFIYDGALSSHYNGAQSVVAIRTHVDLGRENSLFTDPGKPEAPSCQVTTGGPPYSFSKYGGGTFTFAYSVVYPNGGFGPTSDLVTCTMNGQTQQTTLTVPPSATVGGIGYYWYFGFGKGVLGNGIGHTTSTNLVVPVVGAGGFSNSSAAGGGPTGIRGPLIWAAQLKTGSEGTIGQCFSSTSPAVCGSNIDGFVAIPAGSSSIVVHTTSVTAKSEISLTFDTTQGANLGVTCNTSPQQPYISARTSGTSFTISVPTSFSKNPGCIGFHLKN